jgi:HAMP domain-containing protein
MTKPQIAKKIKELLQDIDSGMFSEEQTKKMKAEVENLKSYYLKSYY